MVVAACGARTGLPVGEVGPSETSSCTPHDVPLRLPVPNLYFVLDRSESMNQMNKWGLVRGEIANLMATVGARARFGATVFPSPATNLCDAGVEVLSLRTGQGAVTAAELLLATGMAPEGGTPTAATFRALLPKLTAFEGPTFAILATDGGPNCNATLRCGVDECTANLDQVDPTCQPGVPPNCCAPDGLGGPEDCLDGQSTVDALSALAAAGVRTFVIGIPGSAPYDSLLNQLAQAGGAARPALPSYFRVDTADAQALEAVFAQIAVQATATCTVPLGSPLPDASEVNVVLDGATVPRDPSNGWRLDGSTLTLLGATCNRVLAEGSGGLHVTAGCPTVTR